MSNYKNPLIEPLDHGFGRSRGGLSTKLHHLVDGHGLPLVIVVTPGQSGDSPMLIPMLEHPRIARPVGRPRTRPDRLRGDKAYSSRAIRSHLRDRDDYRSRNVIERRFAGLKQWRGLATRYDKLATVYRSAAVLHAVIAWSAHLRDTA